MSAGEGKRVINKSRIFILLLSLFFISCNIDHHHHDHGDAVISYNANGANSGSSPSAHGSELTIQNNTGHLEKNGYVFDGWNSSPDGSGSNYTPGSSCPSKSMTLYAKWASVFNYNISKSMRTASFSMESASASGSYLHITGLTQRGKQLADIAITETIDGYSVTSIRAGAFRSCSNLKKVTVAGSIRSIGDSAFAGCNNLETVVMKGDNPPEMGTGVLDFCHAVISVPPEAKDAYSNNAGWSSYSTRLVTYYVVTFNSGNASVSAYPSEKQVIYPATTVGSLPSDPVRSGYVFGGWYTSPNGAGALFSENTEVTSNLTVYAKWIPISQDTGIRINFSIEGFKDARVPSHLFQNTTPDSNATYYYKAVPCWTSDLTKVVGATEDFVRLPYNYSIKTRNVDMGLFTPGTWNFDVKVVSSKGVTLYEKKLNNYKISSQSSNIRFVLEKHYEGTGTLQINALADAVSDNGGMIISYKGAQSGTITIPMADSQSGAEGTALFAKTLSLSPGFYEVDFTLYDEGKNRAIKSGYIELFGNETSVLNCVVYKDTWMAEGYSDVGISGVFFTEKKKLGMIVSTNGNIYSRTWTFTASQTGDSENIKSYVWYVNGKRQDVTGSVFVLRNLNPGDYQVHCFAVDNTLSYIVGAGITIPVM